VPLKSSRIHPWLLESADSVDSARGSRGFDHRESRRLLPPPRQRPIRVRSVEPVWCFEQGASVSSTGAASTHIAEPFAHLSLRQGVRFGNAVATFEDDQTKAKHTDGEPVGGGGEQLGPVAEVGLPRLPEPSVARQGDGVPGARRICAVRPGSPRRLPRRTLRWLRRRAGTPSRRSTIS